MPILSNLRVNDPTGSQRLPDFQRCLRVTREIVGRATEGRPTNGETRDSDQEHVEATTVRVGPESMPGLAPTWTEPAWPFVVSAFQRTLTVCPPSSCTTAVATGRPRSVTTVASTGLPSTRKSLSLPPTGP